MKKDVEKSNVIMDFSHLVYKDNNRSKLIDWNKSIGSIVKFTYHDIHDRVIHG